MELQQLHTQSPMVGYAESRRGGRDENQDSYGYSDTPFGLLVTVCDGMGGGPAGKTASDIAVREIIQGVLDASGDDTVVNILIKAVRRANMAIINAGEVSAELRGMGSTCTVLLVNDRSATVAHVGDSRVYQVRGHSKIFRTFDHSMVFDLVRQKIITEEQARLSVQSNIITCALGIKPDVEIDTAELPYHKSDRFILCSDGIHGAMPEPELIAMFANRRVALGQVVDEIATQVDGAGRMAGCQHDNLTLVVVEMQTNSILKDKMSKCTKLIIGILAAVCLASLGLNIFMCSTRSTPVPATDRQTALYMVDSLQRAIDSITIRLNEADTDLSQVSEQLKQKIGQIDEDQQKLNRQLATIDALENRIAELEKTEPSDKKR